jgi:predicted deacetylase
MKKLYAALFVLALTAGFSAAHFHRTFNPHIAVFKWPHEKKVAFTITCDDVSSGYALEYLEEIQSVLEQHDMRATLFVIPYHGEWDLLTDSPQFVSALHEAEDKGHEIALHGYAHYQDEFVCSPERQEQLLEKALSIMQDAGFSVKGFRAPCLKATPETLEILKEYNFVYDSSTFGESGEPSFDGAVPQIPSGHEYTWYITEEELSESLAVARREFETKLEEGTVFSLVTHMKAVNEGEGITFLRDFLPYIQENVWNFTLAELVAWELQHQRILWESRKTITGGEITFQNIPAGLVADIRLPSYYHLKNPPQGIEVVTNEEGRTRLFKVTFDQYFVEVTLSYSSIHIIT